MPELSVAPELVDQVLAERRAASEASERAAIAAELEQKAERERELAEHRRIVDEAVAEGRLALAEAGPCVVTIARLIGDSPNQTR